MHQTSYAMVDSDLDNNPKIMRAGREAREVYLFVLRRNAVRGRPGYIPAAELDPEYLSAKLMMTVDEASRGVTRCHDVSLLSRDGDRIMICGWDESWSRRPKTDAERKAAQRARQSTQDVTNLSHGKSRDVTTSHACHVEEKSREEKKRESVPAAPATKPDPANRGKQLAPEWQPGPSAAKAMAKAKARGVDLEVELEKLRDWALSSGKTSKDWDARWRLWLNGAKGSVPLRPAQTTWQTERDRINSEIRVIPKL